MDKATSFLKFIFYISVLFLIIISLYPGSLFGILFYGDSALQPNLALNPFFTLLPRHLYTFGSIINHFIIKFPSICQLINRFQNNVPMFYPTCIL